MQIQASISAAIYGVFALVFLVSGPRAFAAPAAEEALIEVNETATGSDDYFCWSPTLSRIRLLHSTVGSVTVKLTSAESASGGSVAFQGYDGTRPSRSTYNPKGFLSVTLPGDGTAVRFWVSGARRSVEDKDVRIVATTASGKTIGSIPVMVRVRRDANNLTPREVEHLTSALRKLHDVDNNFAASAYEKYTQAHDQAFFVGIHGAPMGAPLFLAWHRAFLLSFERELQAIDPRVALPYWRFDRPSTIFTREFMGTVPCNGFSAVDFAKTNNLQGWGRDGQDTPLLRRCDGTKPPIAEGVLDAGMKDKDYRTFNGRVESRYHNGAHAYISGWLGQGWSPSDPLFYLLHANVDRGWAVWQATNDRFDPTSELSYHAQGTYPGNTDANRHPKSSYVDDLMWPWSGDTGNNTPDDPLDDWPTVAISMPPGSPGSGPSKVTPGSMIDYLDVRGKGEPLQACYSDVGFDGKPIAESLH